MIPSEGGKLEWVISSDLGIGERRLRDRGDGGQKARTVLEPIRVLCGIWTPVPARLGCRRRDALAAAAPAADAQAWVTVGAFRRSSLSECCPLWLLGWMLKE